HNFCISPLTPFALKGFVWIPGKENISNDVSKYARSLEVLAESLAGTFGQERMHFAFGQPTASLVTGITAPRIDGATSVTMDAWPKTIGDVAEEIGDRLSKRSPSR
ncbi:MAG: hypothetical protein AAF517_27055, partial [Planctomycetota bacterium]